MNSFIWIGSYVELSDPVLIDQITQTMILKCPKENCRQNMPEWRLTGKYCNQCASELIKVPLIPFVNKKEISFYELCDENKYFKNLHFLNRNEVNIGHFNYLGAKNFIKISSDQAINFNQKSIKKDIDNFKKILVKIKPTLNKYFKFTSDVKWGFISHFEESDY